jgi:hypothetical protein
MSVFWDVVLCDMVDINRRFRGAHSDDGGSKLFRNVGQYLSDYTMQHPKIQLVAVRTSNLTLKLSNVSHLSHILQ